MYLPWKFPCRLWTHIDTNVQFLLVPSCSSVWALTQLWVTVEKYGYRGIRRNKTFISICVHVTILLIAICSRRTSASYLFRHNAPLNVVIYGKYLIKFRLSRPAVPTSVINKFVIANVRWRVDAVFELHRRHDGRAGARAPGIHLVVTTRERYTSAN